MAYQFRESRRIVNGLDKADLIAGYASAWLKKIPSLVTYSAVTPYLNDARPTPQVIPNGSYKIVSAIGEPSSSAQIYTGIAIGGSSITPPMGVNGRPVIDSNAVLPSFKEFYAALPQNISDILGKLPQLGSNAVSPTRPQAAPSPATISSSSVTAPWVLANFAVLDTIAQSLGTYDLKLEAFTFIEGGGKVTDDSKHPGGGKRAGRYLLDEATWQRVKGTAANITKFDDDGQTGAAVALLKERGSYIDDLKAGRYEQILGYASKQWTEMPGGNREKLSKAAALDFFNTRLKTMQAGATIATPVPVPTAPSSSGATPSPVPSGVLVDPRSPSVTPTPGLSAPQGSPDFTGNGIGIRIAMGFWDSPEVRLFDFSYTSIDVDMSGLPMVTVSGKSVKWNLTRGRSGAVGKTYTNASLFDVATAVAAENGVPITITGDVDPTIPYAVQDTDDRNFLIKLANEYGYRLREYNGMAELTPMAAAVDSNFIVSYGMTSGLTFSDAADSQRIILRDSFADFGKATAAKINLLTGKIEYPKSIESVLPSSTIPPDGTQIGRGYPATVGLELTDKTLPLRPGQLVWLDYSVAPNPFARDWRVDRVTHTIDNSGAKTNLSIYLPVYIKQQGDGTTAPGSPSPSPAPGVTPAPGITSLPGITPPPTAAKLTPQQIFDKYAEAVVYIKGSQGLGTGFIVTEQGHFISCNHVVNNATSTVTLKTGETLTYEMVGTNQSKDLFVGKLTNYTKGKVCFCALVADENTPNGSTLTAIGHPLDVKWKLTSAKRTGTSKCVSWRGNTELDCVKSEKTLVDRGNSGGPVFNDRGEVVGMAESQNESNDGSTKIEWIRQYFVEVTGIKIPEIKPVVAPTPVPAPIPQPASTPTPFPLPTPVPSRPAQATNAAELETLTAVYMINPEPGGRVTSPFGFRKHPVQGGNKRHNGADIAKGLGTKILAMSAGIVVADKDTGSGYGNWVILYHGKIAGKKIYGGYCHNSKVYVKKGDFVNQGQHIADEGATGMVTGSHLHQFTTYGNHDWTNGNYLSNSSSEYIDPIKNFIGKMFTGTVDTSGQLDNGIKGGTTLPNT